MLYVFHVDAGTMLTFEMNIALQSVANLRQAIERKTKIPASSLVLLVSGGIALDGERKVSSYSAGTDTNPIFMFSKPSIRDDYRQGYQHSVDYDYDLSPISDLSPSVEMRYVNVGSELKTPVDMKPLVEACCSLPPCHTTVAKCAQLGQQFAEVAVDFLKRCESLFHAQHLQHQGWAAVVANLEDIYTEFCQRSVRFKDSIKEHRQKKEKYHQDLSTINTVLQELGGIPMLSALRVNAEAHRFSAFDELDDGYDIGGHYCHTSDMDNSENKGFADFGAHVMMSNDDVFAVQKSGSGGEGSRTAPLNESDEGVTFRARSHSHSHTDDQYTLLHWILAKENKAALDDIIDYCKKGLHLMESDPSKESEVELYKMLEFANAHGLKTIKGIESRLSALDDLIAEVRRLKDEQIEISNALVQNRERLSAVSDPSVLPTLCGSHRVHLHTMLNNHENLIDRHRRIAKSKDELSGILKARLGTVLKIENLMSKQDAHCMLNFQCFARLKRYFDVVEQLHSAPELFARAVHETARRRVFSDAFLQWASELACHLLTIHNDEVVRRQEFNSQFHDHFLSALFPGTEDMPPAFASQAPTDFDSRLPKLTDEDVEFVTKTFPELTKDINKCNMESVVEFFKSRGFDSETENTESEKAIEICRADASTDCSPDMAAVSTITEETMDTLKADVDKLTSFLVSMYRLCRTVVTMHSDLAKMRSHVEEQRQFLRFQCSEIHSACARSSEQTAQRTREQLQKLTVDHELELSDMKKVMAEKDDTITGLYSDIEELKKEQETMIHQLQQSHDETKTILQKSRDEYTWLEKKIEDIEVQKQKDIKELTDKMHLEYKAEIESLRSRFRLVAITNMDRSPSESSLEKIERTDVIEIASHNQIVQQTKENMEVEKEEAVKEAMEKCERECQERLSEMKNKHEADKQVTLNETVRRIIDEKDRQLELSREREATLVRECSKYKETIQQLSDPETSDYETLLKTQLANIENERALLAAKFEDLQRELERRSEEKEMEKTKEDADGSAKSPPSSSGRDDKPGRRSVRGHTPMGIAPGTLTLSSCLPGHTVLLMWDPAHCSYTVLQESPVMYFVHSDCLPALDLSVAVKSESERKLYAVATVESKEYCYAKKSGNRYHVPRGSRFYRVRVRPSRAAHAPPSCCEHRHARTHGSLKGGTVLLCEQRPVKKWLTFLHAPDIQKCQETSPSTSSATESDTTRSADVPVACDLIALSPVEPTRPVLDGCEFKEKRDSRSELDESTSVCMDESVIAPLPTIDQEDFIEAEHNEMESSVALVTPQPPLASLPLELTVSTQSVIARTDFPVELTVSSQSVAAHTDFPLELTVSTQSIVAHAPTHSVQAGAEHVLADLFESEIAEEATP